MMTFSRIRSDGRLRNSLKVSNDEFFGSLRFAIPAGREMKGNECQRACQLWVREKVTALLLTAGGDFIGDDKMHRYYNLSKHSILNTFLFVSFCSILFNVEGPTKFGCGFAALGYLFSFYSLPFIHSLLTSYRCSPKVTLNPFDWLMAGRDLQLS